MTDIARTPARRRRLRAAGFGLLAAVVALIFVEGASSVLVLGGDAARVFDTLPERAHTQHDPDLGWVSVPGFAEPDFYGPGLGLHVNEQGFRHHGRVALRTPPDRARVICAGDGLTFGAGVADSATWCAWLGTLDGRLETVNMGQVGYGLDQTYLWHMRDAAGLEHDVHLLAVTAQSLERMRLREVWSYDKPTLRLVDGMVTTSHVPLPDHSPLGIRLRRLGRVAARSQTAALVRRAVGASAKAPANDLLPGPSGMDPRDGVLRALLGSLADRHRAGGGVPVLVLLPAREDYADWSRDQWRSTAREAARSLLPVVDLVAELRAEAADGVTTYFLPDDESVSPLARGRYSAAGHQFLARALHRRLMEMPLIERRLQPGRDR